MLKKALSCVVAASMLVLVGCRSQEYKMPGGYTYPVRKPAEATKAPVMIAPAPVKTAPLGTNAAVRTVAPAVATPAPAAVRAAPAPAAAPAAPAVRSADAPAAVKPVAPPAFKAPETPREMMSADSATVYRLKQGDPLVVYLRGIPGVPGGEQMIEDVVDEFGVINLPFIDAIQAGGRTTTEIESSVRNAYLDQQIYKYITVNVVVPARSYYVRGEIRQPGRYPLISGVTIVQAIAAAGGFTEFANPRKVEVLRGQTRFQVDTRELEKYPDRDKAIDAGDVIIVSRSFF